MFGITSATQMQLLVAVYDLTPFGEQVSVVKIMVHIRGQRFFASFDQEDIVGVLEDLEESQAPFIAHKTARRRMPGGATVEHKLYWATVRGRDRVERVRSQRQANSTRFVRVNQQP